MQILSRQISELKPISLVQSLVLNCPALWHIIKKTELCKLSQWQCQDSIANIIVAIMSSSSSKHKLCHYIITMSVCTCIFYLLTRGIFDSQLSKLPETNICFPWPPHRKTVGSLRTFMSIPEPTDLVCKPIDFDSHCTGTKIQRSQ